MRAHTVNYRARDAAYHRRGQIVNVGFFLTGLPRLIPVCRLLGHRPVVDGIYDRPTSTGVTYGVRWVVCDRCGTRGEPQGSLDPVRYVIGDRYAGPWKADVPTGAGTTESRYGTRLSVPGPIGVRPRGELGGQLVIGANQSGWGVEVKVGNAGSEHTLAASIHCGWMGALYLHTERFGQGIQRRLNPTGYQSRVSGLRWSGGCLTWMLWARRDEHADTDPWWQYHLFDLRIRDKVLGPRRYAYTDVPGGEVSRLVRMPEGDYLVGLKLQRRRFGRRRGRPRCSWTVEWNTLGRGIPTRGPGRNKTLGSGVDVSDRSVRVGTWPSEATAAIVAQMTAERTQYEWEPGGLVPIGVEQSP